jgi:hypothetical protein
MKGVIFKISDDILIQLSESITTIWLMPFTPTSTATPAFGKGRGTTGSNRQHCGHSLKATAGAVDGN